MKRAAPTLMLAMLLAALLNFSVAKEKFDPPCLNQQFSMSKQRNMSESFSMPEVVSMDSYDWLRIDNCSYISKPGQPMLPVKNLVFKLPEGSSVTSIKVEVNESYLHGSFKVVPAPCPVIAGMETSPGNFSEDPNIYVSASIFPEEWYVCRYTHGLDPETMTRVEYLVINFYPLRFLPAQREVLRAESVSATIDYVEVATLDPLVKLWNLIITSDTLEPYAIQLAKHKNDTGISSKVLNTTWIYGHYMGNDSQEKIRNCIKDFVATYGIVYVTIFGDADQVPVRLVYVPDGQDTYTPTDLYYADLDGTWDDNHDGLYADQRYDNVDGIPDVCVGRIPPSLVEYAQTAVDKIIGYQQHFNTSENWTKRVVLAAGTGSGDGFSDPFGVAFPFLKNYTANININKDIVKLYETYGNLSTGSMASEINKGALFVNFAGHGNPGLWLFYWVNAWLGWYNGYGIADVQSLANGFKLPVVTTMACSTARFDDQDCIGEWFVLEPDGGSIAYFGATRIAWGYGDQSITWGLMGEMDWRIYQAFYEGYTRLGQMWGVPVTRYVQSHIWNYASASVYDVKTLMEFVLLGDPTLRIYDPKYPETLKVPQDFPTIQSAINAAYDGDTVFVRNGTYCEHVVVNKTVSLIGENRETAIIDGNGTGKVVHIVVDNVNITQFTIRNSGSDYPDGGGIYLSDSRNCNISFNILTSNYVGIWLWGSSHNYLMSNIAFNNSCGAIELRGSVDNILVDNNMSRNLRGINMPSSSNNLIINNTATYNTWDGIHVYSYSSYNVFVGNDLSNNDFSGIDLDSYSSNNNLTGNTIYNNSEEGIRIGLRCMFNALTDNSIMDGKKGIHLYDWANNNTLISNTVSSNQYGIWFDSWPSSNNTIFHNNFVNNSNQVYIKEQINNIWDDGYPSGGNYWSDYEGLDLFSGPFQNETGSDEIGDTLYAIDANNVDHYPLMKPLSSEGAVVRIIPETVWLGSGYLVGEVFKVAVVVENVYDLYGFDIQLSWNSTYLECSSRMVTVPLDSYQNPIQPSRYPGILYKGNLGVFELSNVIDEQGSIPGAEPGTMAWISYSQQGGVVPSFNGSGTICILTFRVKKQPLADVETLIHFTFTGLSTRNGQPIPHTVKDCKVRIPGFRCILGGSCHPYLGARYK